jgi:predicted MFS family arabinose efflux permease
MERSATARAVLGPFCFAYYLSYLLRSINALLAPELSRELGLGPADLGLLTSAYFFAFGVGQLPVGLALDRYGPRRVVGGLLAVSAAGSALFALGRGFAALAVGRALMGLGVSAVLMGAFKAMQDNLPERRHTALTAAVMAAGTLGALTATTPLTAVLPWLGWRGAVAAVGALTAAAAVIVLAAAAPGGGPEGERVTLRALGSIFRSRRYWRFGPQAALFTGGFMALQGLWIVSWLMVVEGRGRAQAATVMMLFTLSMLTGQLTIAALAAPAERAGWGRARLMVGSLVLALVVLGLAIAGARGPWPWLLFGFFGAASAQVYGVTTAQFPASFSGRVSTATNLLAFAGAFAVQGGIGAAVEALTPRLGAILAFRVTFGALWVLQAGAVAWSAIAPPEA